MSSNSLKNRFWLSREGKFVIVEGGAKDTYYSRTKGPLYEPVKFKKPVKRDGYTNTGHATADAFVRNAVQLYKAMPLAFHHNEIVDGHVRLLHFDDYYEIVLTERRENPYNDLLMFNATCNGRLALVEFFTRKQSRTQNVYVHGRVWGIDDEGKRNFVILEQ